MPPLFLDIDRVSGLPDAGEVLDTLARRGWTHAWLGEGLPAGPGWRAGWGSWAGRCWLVERGPGPHGSPPWNLASTDETHRRTAVREALEALRVSAGEGAACHILHAGVARTGGAQASDPVPWGKAFDQLCRSLDVLASLAQDRKLSIGIPTQGPALPERPLGGEVDALVRALGRLEAPVLGLYLDVTPPGSAEQAEEGCPWAPPAVPATWLSGLRLRGWQPDWGEPTHPVGAALAGLDPATGRLVLTSRAGTLEALEQGATAVRSAWERTFTSSKSQG